AELLQPDRLSVILLDAESNRLAVTYDTHPVPARTDDPLLQLALRHGPLAFPKNVREEARRRGAELPADAPPPGSWLGAPPPAGLVGPRGARPRRAVGEHGGDPRGRAHAAPDRHPHGRAGLRGPRVRGPDRTAPVAGATHTV